MVTCTINIPPMLAYIPAPWILWVMAKNQICVQPIQPHRLGVDANGLPNRLDDNRVEDPCYTAMLDPVIPGIIPENGDL